MSASTKTKVPVVAALSFATGKPYDELLADFEQLTPEQQKEADRKYLESWNVYHSTKTENEFNSMLDEFKQHDPFEGFEFPDFISALPPIPPLPEYEFPPISDFLNTKAKPKK